MTHEQNKNINEESETIKKNKSEILNISWNVNQKRAGVTILILNKKKFNPKIPAKDKEDI